MSLVRRTASRLNSPYVQTELYRYRIRRTLSSRNPWILTRTACLGNDLYRMTGFALPRVNIQKGRVDLLRKQLEQEQNSHLPFRYFSAFKRADVWPLIVEQESSWWRAKTAPALLLLDSFSELTDQAFQPPHHQSFACNFRDLKEGAIEEFDFVPQGLVGIESLQDEYFAFFRAVRRLWPRLPIVFVHFPTHQETRSLFLDRAAAILEAVDTFAASDPAMRSISLDQISPGINAPGSESTVEDWQPYHYDKEVYSLLTIQLAESLAELGMLGTMQSTDVEPPNGP